MHTLIAVCVTGALAAISIFCSVEIAPDVARIRRALRRRFGRMPAGHVARIRLDGRTEVVSYNATGGLGGFGYAVGPGRPVTVRSGAHERRWPRRAAL